jgi:hypothetical protein
MVNEVSIRYEPVMTGSHFSREPLGLGCNCLKKNLKSLPVLVQGFKNFKRTSSPVLDLVLHISRPLLQGPE